MTSKAARAAARQAAAQHRTRADRRRELRIAFGSAILGAILGALIPIGVQALYFEPRNERAAAAAQRAAADGTLALADINNLRDNVREASGSGGDGAELRPADAPGFALDTDIDIAVEIQPYIDAAKAYYDRGEYEKARLAAQVGNSCLAELTGHGIAHARGSDCDLEAIQKL